MNPCLLSVYNLIKTHFRSFEWFKSFTQISRLAIHVLDFFKLSVKNAIFCLSPRKVLWHSKKGKGPYNVSCIKPIINFYLKFISDATAMLVKTSKPKHVSLAYHAIFFFFSGLYSFISRLRLLGNLFILFVLCTQLSTLQYFA